MREAALGAGEDGARTVGWVWPSPESSDVGARCPGCGGSVGSEVRKCPGVNDWWDFRRSRGRGQGSGVMAVRRPARLWLACGFMGRCWGGRSGGHGGRCRGKGARSEGRLAPRAPAAGARGGGACVPRPVACKTSGRECSGDSYPLPSPPLCSDFLGSPLAGELEYPQLAPGGGNRSVGNQVFPPSSVTPGEGRLSRAPVTEPWDASGGGERTLSPAVPRGRKVCGPAPRFWTPGGSQQQEVTVSGFWRACTPSLGVGGSGRHEAPGGAAPRSSRSPGHCSPPRVRLCPEHSGRAVLRAHCAPVGAKALFSNKATFPRRT